MKLIPLKKRLEVRKKPSDTPIMHQDWRNLLFLHWKYDPKIIQKTLPAGLYVDTFEEEAYITVTPFFIENFSFVNLPPLPFLSNFIEVNARTYVFDENGIPGIWFYSLDINSVLAVSAAREALALPYFFADLEGERHGKKIIIEGERSESANSFMSFNYNAVEAIEIAENDSLDFFLIERYVLFSSRNKELYLQQVHHKPYLIKEINRFDVTHNLFKINALKNPKHESPDYAHFSPGVNVDIFKLKKDPIFDI